MRRRSQKQSVRHVRVDLDHRDCRSAEIKGLHRQLPTVNLPDRLNWLFFATGGLDVTNEKSNLTGPVGFLCGTGAFNSPPCSSRRALS